MKVKLKEETEKRAQVGDLYKHISGDVYMAISSDSGGLVLYCLQEHNLFCGDSMFSIYRKDFTRLPKGSIVELEQE